MADSKARNFGWLIRERRCRLDLTLEESLGASKRRARHDEVPRVRWCPQASYNSATL